MPLKLHPPGTLGPYWTVRGTIGGRRISRSTKTLVRGRAETLRLKWETELEDRRIHGDAVTATFAEALIDYIKQGGSKRFLKPLLDRFGARAISNISQRDLDDTARALYPAAAPATLNRQVYTPFIAVYNHAVIRDMARPRNWARPRGHAGERVLRWLWPDEVDACLAAAAPHARAVIELFVATGFREQEGVGLEWRDVRLETINNQDRGEAWTWRTKTGAPRRVDLFPRTVRVLRDLRDMHGADGRVLRNAGGAPFVLQPDGGGALRTTLKVVAHDAGVDRFGAHILRHTWATWRYACTLDLLDLKYAGGWKGAEAERYAHLAPRTLADDLTKRGWNPTIFRPAIADVHGQFPSNADNDRQAEKRQNAV